MGYDSDKLHCFWTKGLKGSVLLSSRNETTKTVTRFLSHKRTIYADFGLAGAQRYLLYFVSIEKSNSESTNVFFYEFHSRKSRTVDRC